MQPDVDLYLPPESTRNLVLGYRDTDGDIHALAESDAGRLQLFREEVDDVE